MRAEVPAERFEAHPFGPGWALRASGTGTVLQRRVTGRDGLSDQLKLVLQLRGSARVRAAGRSEAMAAGDLALLDAAGAFRLELSGDYEQLIVQLPRDLVARRHPRLIGRAGVIAGGEQPSVVLFHAAVRTLVQGVGGLDPARRAGVFDGVVSLLGLLAPDPPEGDRFERALADIDAALADPGLTVEAVARRQGISRRRLDAIFAAHGARAAATIRDRRLDRIASELGDPAKRGLGVADIAFGWGFCSEAHFSRAFRRRFGQSPSQYRRGLSDGS